MFRSWLRRPPGLRERTLMARAGIKISPTRKPRTKASVARPVTCGVVWLICSRRCGGALFRPLFAEVEVDASGEYQGHQLLQPGYICLNCGAPAMDLGEVPTTMARDADDDLAATAAALVCPVCETLVSVIPGDDCPNCGASLEVAPS